jgi:hypothetical protein
MSTEAGVEKVADAQHVELAEGKHDVEDSGDVVLIGQAGNVQRIPIPSADPNDPLNFSRWQKLGIITCCCWFCKFVAARKLQVHLSHLPAIFSLVLVGGLGPILGQLIGAYAPQGETIQSVVNLSTYPSMVMALGG